MRIVMVGPFGLHLKGTMSVRALPLAQALAGRGHEVTLLLPPWDCPEDSGRCWFEGPVCIEHITLLPAFPLLGRLIIAGRLLRRTLALRPDVVYCFKPKAYAGAVAWCLWQLRRLRLVSLRLVIDSDDWEGWGGWNELGDYSKMEKRIFAWQEQWGLRHHDALTVASRALETIVWSMGVAPERVFYLPNGARQESRAGGERPGDGVVLLYTRFWEYRLERVVDVFRRIYDARPNMRFLVVGQGLTGEEREFARLCRQAGLNDAVEMAGWVTAADLPGCFARADVALYPFDDILVNRAKCSVKLLDLMAAGVPVVADAVGQNAETIEHGVSGLLVPSGNAAAMANAALQVLADPVLRRRLAEGGEARVQACLTWDRLAGQAERALLNAPSPGEK